MPNPETIPKTSKHLSAMPKESELGSNEVVPAHTGSKSFAKYSIGQPKDPSNYDPIYNRLDYGHQSNDAVLLDYEHKSFNNEAKEILKDYAEYSNPSLMKRDYSQKKVFNMNTLYYNHSSIRKDYFECPSTYAVSKTFVTHKNYQTKKNKSSKYPVDHYGNSVMRSYQHFEGTLRKPFNKFWQGYRIKYMLDDKYSAYTNSKYRTNLYNIYKDGSNYAIKLVPCTAAGLARHVPLDVIKYRDCYC